MIKFFRKIRQNMLNEGKTSKYFKYAIGEIILVVIGILLALQINNWNEERKNRIEETALLEQLHSEFKSNLAQLDGKIIIRNSMIDASLKLLNYVDNPLERNKDSILKHLSFTRLSPTFDPIVNDISSSGRIQLLSNNKLKELLSIWTSEIIQVTEEEVSWRIYNENHYRPFILEFWSLRNAFNQFWKNNTMEDFHLEKGTVVAFDLKNSKRNTDILKLFDQPKFEDHLASCAAYSKLINSQSLSLRKRIVEILNMIENQLKENK